MSFFLLNSCVLFMNQFIEKQRNRLPTKFSIPQINKWKSFFTGIDWILNIRRAEAHLKKSGTNWGHSEASIRRKLFEIYAVSIYASSRMPLTLKISKLSAKLYVTWCYIDSWKNENLINIYSNNIGIFVVPICQIWVELVAWITISWQIVCCRKWVQ